MNTKNWCSLQDLLVGNRSTSKLRSPTKCFSQGRLSCLKASPQAQVAQAGVATPHWPVGLWLIHEMTIYDQVKLVNWSCIMGWAETREPHGGRWNAEACGPSKRSKRCKAFSKLAISTCKDVSQKVRSGAAEFSSFYIWCSSWSLGILWVQPVIVWKMTLGIKFTKTLQGDWPPVSHSCFAWWAEFSCSSFEILCFHSCCAGPGLFE